MDTGRNREDRTACYSDGLNHVMRKPSLKINALSNWAALATSIAVGFFLTPFIIRSLGVSGYGIWTLVMSFVGYYGLLNLGIGSAITRYIARYSAQGNRKALSEVASTVLVMFTITGTLVIVVSFAFADAIATFFNVEAADRSHFSNLVRIVSITVGLSFPGSVFAGIVTAREHYVAKNVTVVFQEIFRAGLTVLFLNLGWGILGVGLAPLISETMGGVINFVLFRVFAADIHLRMVCVHWNTLRMLLVYGGVTTIISIADIMRINLDSFVIGKWMTMDAVGIYGVAALLIRYMMKVIASATGVLGPRFASLEGRGDHAEIIQLLLRSLRIAALLSFGMAFFAIAFGPRFILLWAGEPYGAAVPVLVIISIAYASALSQNPSLGLMYALNKHHYYAFYTLIEALANVGLSILLVRHYGIIGVALGTAVPMLIVKCVIMPIYVSRIANVPLRAYLRAFALPGLSVVILSVVFYACRLDTVVLHRSVAWYLTVLGAFGAGYVCILIAGYRRMTSNIQVA